MQKFGIWAEGYAATGQRSGAVKLAEGIEAKTFASACNKYAMQDNSFKQYYNPKTLTYWGCKLFDNEADARKSFG